MNLNKEIFYKDALPFFEAGLLKEIYSNDDLCVCNISNQCYGVFNYVKSKEGQCGMTIIPEHVKGIVSDPIYLQKLVAGLDKKALTKSIFVLDERMFEIMQKFKKVNDVKGPTSDIDIQMEEELLTKKINKK